MRKAPWCPLWAVGSILAVLGLAGCQQETHEERVERLRGNYVAELREGGFFIREEPLVEALPDEALDDADDEEALGEPEEEPADVDEDELEELEEAPVAVRQDAVL